MQQRGPQEPEEGFHRSVRRPHMLGVNRHAITLKSARIDRPGYR
jgi:hypothetical protein